MEKWFVAAKKADFDKWGADYRISPVLARIIRNRDITDEEQLRMFLNGGLEDCHSPWLLKDMEKAVDIVLKAIDQGKKIRVIGDYDVDGICSAYILTKGFRILGADTDTAIPHRIHDGYGLNDHLIELAAEDGIDLIVTCDNGIAQDAQITLAAQKGMGVIVTDHHEVPFEEIHGRRQELPPPALAVVDPKQADCPYPFKGICGGVVAWKFLLALLEKTGNKVLSRAMDEFLTFAALATVCDVMELKDENRIIVKEGLKRIRHTENEGLRALIEVNGLTPDSISAYHFGFVLGPCLNATGRLDSAKRALELLGSHTSAEAMNAARALKELNDSRKNLTVEGVTQAEHYIAEHHLEKDPVMLIFLPDVHESIAGIIAGRIREKYNHPVFLLTRSEDGVKGSGRSIEAYHMYEHMTRQKKYFIKFGGHKLAAGLSMREEDIEALRRDFNEDSGLTEEDFIPRVHIDVPMPFSYADEAFAEELKKLEPFGVGNPKPLFAQKNLIFLSGKKIGAAGNFAKFQVLTPEGKKEQVLFFGDLCKFINFLDQKFGSGAGEKIFIHNCEYRLSVVYELSLNEFRGQKERQFVMKYYC
mgnify:CR=1 FL=1